MKVAVFLLVFLPVSFVSAAEKFPVTARLFAGTVSTKPEDLNTEMKAQNLKEFTNVTQFGAEATYPLTFFIDVGFRYTKRIQKMAESPDNILTDYEGEITQDSVYGVLRIPFVRTPIIRADVVGAVGGANTTFKIKTASQDGELTKKSEGASFASMVMNYGGSIAVGFKGVYLVVEAGVETNKMDKFKRSGTINSNVDKIDISGPYVTVGLMFDGVTATRK